MLDVTLMDFSSTFPDHTMKDDKNLLLEPWRSLSFEPDEINIIGVICMCMMKRIVSIWRICFEKRINKNIKKCYLA